MPKLSPIKHKTLVKRLKQFGFEGPFPGGKHLYMIKNEIRLTLPNPHRNEIGIDLLRKILKQAGISPNDYLNA